MRKIPVTACVRFWSDSRDSAKARLWSVASCTTTCLGALPPRDALAALGAAGVPICEVAPRLRPDTSTATDRIAR